MAAPNRPAPRPAGCCCDRRTTRQTCRAAGCNACLALPRTTTTTPTTTGDTR